MLILWRRRTCNKVKHWNFSSSDWLFIHLTTAAKFQGGSSMKVGSTEQQWGFGLLLAKKQHLSYDSNPRRVESWCNSNSGRLIYFPGDSSHALVCGSHDLISTVETGCEMQSGDLDGVKGTTNKFSKLNKAENCLLCKDIMSPLLENEVPLILIVVI